jgi:hypothetical protein
LRTRDGTLFDASSLSDLALALEPNSWSKITTLFEARRNQPTEWRIALPDELIETVRSALKAGNSGRQKPPAPATAGSRL